MEIDNNKINELAKEISNLLWEKNRTNLNYTQRLDIERKLSKKKEEFNNLTLQNKQYKDDDDNEKIK